MGDHRKISLALYDWENINAYSNRSRKLHIIPRSSLDSHLYANWIAFVMNTEQNFENYWNYLCLLFVNLKLNKTKKMFAYREESPDQAVYPKHAISRKMWNNISLPWNKCGVIKVIRVVIILYVLSFCPFTEARHGVPSMRAYRESFLQVWTEWVNLYNTTFLRVLVDYHPQGRRRMEYS